MKNPLENPHVKQLSTIGGLFAIGTIIVTVVRSEKVSLFISSLRGKGE